jgi:hypothetical protein
MKAYCIVYECLDDPTMFEAYRRQVMATIEPYRGKFLVRGGKFTVLEGEMPFERIGLLEFPSAQGSGGLVQIRPRIRQSCRCASRLRAASSSWPTASNRARASLDVNTRSRVSATRGATAPQPGGGPPRRLDARRTFGGPSRAAASGVRSSRSIAR